MEEWLEDIIYRANLEYHIYQQHHDWIEAWEWLKDFSTHGGKLEEDYTIDTNQQNNG
jgi:hypothetical protein